jgi:mannose-1-phosphate guanylyltransferase
MEPMIQRWLGTKRPKQYCAFVGRRSMFQHTVDRANRLTDPTRTVSVVARRHQKDVWRQLEGRAGGKVLLQPANCDTAPGLFLALTYIKTHDPRSVVAVFPSDHFVYPEERFLDHVRDACAVAQRIGNHLVLLGAKPDSAELDYSWIEPGARVESFHGPRLRTTQALAEKPDVRRAQEMLRSGGLWNTLVLVARVELLWRLGWRCFPEMMALFHRLAAVIGTPDESAVLKRIYKNMPVRNFSSDLLERFPEQVLVMELKGVAWSDWGRPERVTRTLVRIGRRPTFPLSDRKVG